MSKKPQGQIIHMRCFVNRRAATYCNTGGLSHETSTTNFGKVNCQRCIAIRQQQPALVKAG